MPAPPLGITARATVKRVIDGDTLEVEVHWPLTIRLKDCWAPETRGAEREQGLESKAFLQDILPAGREIVFSVDSKDADTLGDLLTFGRVVGQVWIPGDEESVSDVMIDAGKATRTKHEREA